jgi:peptidoglycan-N-acetylmuramic acid deacetylase
MNKKIISIILVLPILLSGCSKLGDIATKDVTTLAKSPVNTNRPAFEEKIVVPEVPEPPETKLGEKQEVDETPKDAEPKQTETKKEDAPKVSIDNTKHNTAEKSWFFQPKKDGTPSGEPPEVLALIQKYSAYYLGDTNNKVIYLTFDEGYENGYSAKILDTLKDNNVKAAFFATSDYIKRNKDLIKRMEAEGHLVCNHSNTHPSMAQSALKGQEKFNEEFTITEKAYEEVTGKKMPKFFRPPMGKYSELSLKYTQDLGYKTIFWSFAYKDWLPEQQPSHEEAKKKIMERTHNGGIFLLHAVSKTNTEIMDSIIKEWKSKGFEFKTLNELP